MDSQADAVTQPKYAPVAPLVWLVGRYVFHEYSRNYLPSTFAGIR
jgi:hypothetical protein